MLDLLSAVLGYLLWVWFLGCVLAVLVVGTILLLGAWRIRQQALQQRAATHPSLEDEAQGDG